MAEADAGKSEAGTGTVSATVSESEITAGNGSINDAENGADTYTAQGQGLGGPR